MSLASSKMLWLEANLQMIAKSIAELDYEQVIQIKPRATTATGDNLQSLSQPLWQPYTLPLNSQVTYHFEAWQTVWDHVRVKASSLRRVYLNRESDHLSAGQFFIDAQHELGMDDIILGNYLEEMHATLFADVELLRKNLGVSAKDLSEMSGEKAQSFLNGHPKILLNKGRLGWGAEDFERYSPEAARPFRLHWLAAHTDQTIVSTDRLQPWQDKIPLYDALREKIIDQGSDPQQYHLLPVHPWQWERIIRLQYAGDLATKQLISLGEHGDFYTPQISLRTLSNISHPERDDIKLPLSILNTSAVRGIPERFIESSSVVSSALTNICKTDPLLSASNTEALEEHLALSFKHGLYAQIKDAPYRYQETLGAIWRQSLHSKLASNEIGILTGSLFHQDLSGRSLIGAYIQKSKLSTSDWLVRYFDAVIIPLYHLQLKYGLGLVAHGQNIVLKLRDYIPCGMFLKDFQGDLRMASTYDQHSPVLQELAKHLDKLPPNYLIHDLLTGHFVTVLRFISAVMHQSDHFPEHEFYRLLAGRIQVYITAHHPGNSIDEQQSLLTKTIDRVLLNKVRFCIGYADRATRPRPMLGSAINNPLNNVAPPQEAIYEQ